MTYVSNTFDKNANRFHVFVNSVIDIIDKI